ncbi:cation:proton antiporter [Thiohalomonas denitrificans]|uniref:cation:proton antiporter n=1 Tax=Thiohalomonas denitrificans TaxID=415747 RepID=UPI0026EF2E77|nr:sodium:proton antiporter [Thiohalomonas denitrificans]
MAEESAVILVGVVVTGVLCQWAAWHLKLPAILLLLLAGILLGPVTGIVDPDALLGDLLFPLASLSVAIILFEGALRLKLHEVTGGLGSVVRNLVSVGALFNWLIMSAAAYTFMGFDWPLSLLFGAVVTVTGPTVIIPLLRTMRPNANISRVLRWEGIIIDPFGAILAILVFKYIISGRSADPLTTFALSAGAGLGAGLLGAALLGFVLRRHLFPGYLINVGTLAFVLAVFTGANSLQAETGLLAVTVMGAFIANMRDVPAEEILDFKESLSVVLISVLFILLAARLDLTPLLDFVYPALALLAAVLFVARPVAVAVSTWRSKLNWRERAVLAWVAPRGIVAAAVSAAFALRLESDGYPGAELLAPLAFMVIIGTVVLQGLTARPVANLLGVSEPEPKGVLIVGAHRVARAMGSSLQENGFPVILADANWEDIGKARMEGLPTYFGNPISAHADRHLDLVGVGRLMVMSHRPDFNALTCLRFKSEFGANRVYALRMPEEGEDKDKREPASRYACPTLFREKVTLPMLSSLLAQGGEIHTTPLTENFSMTEYRKFYRGRAIALFAIDPAGRLRVFTETREPEPDAGWRVIGLLPEELVQLMREERSEVQTDGAG